ncbi:hypothetical protein [Prauserella muralis]|uniref:hypothetical protein n=1 Tax=Prauserella muralis TaxID=588067 RepID=UPI001FEB0623|nr:hypothetical protein [Prauserella muralis]
MGKVNDLDDVRSADQVLDGPACFVVVGGELDGDPPHAVDGRPGVRQKILDADDQTALMLQSIRHHRAMFAAIADRDGLTASRLARESLYAYYADHVSPADRKILADLVRECGGRLPA